MENQKIYETLAKQKLQRELKEKEEIIQELEKGKRKTSLDKLEVENNRLKEMYEKERLARE
jgi:hypothetical protein